MENYDEWSLTQLKNELRRRKARIHGKKADLVQRYVPRPKVLYYYIYVITKLRIGLNLNSVKIFLI